MNAISLWLLSIAGVSILSVLVDVILPNGQTNKYIKGIFAFCMILVIISPIPKLIDKNFNFDNVFVTEDMFIDNEFIYQTNRDRLNLLKYQIESELVEAGLKEIYVSVNGDIFDHKMQIENVFVDLSLLVINSQNQHIDIEKTVKDAVRKFISIEEEKIIINEW